MTRSHFHFPFQQRNKIEGLKRIEQKLQDISPWNVLEVICSLKSRKNILFFGSTLAMNTYGVLFIFSLSGIYLLFPKRPKLRKNNNFVWTLYMLLASASYFLLK